MAETLPTFRYHPDPLRTGQIIASPNKCVVCRKPRGYVYRYASYYRREYVDCICPWCIADGSAHQKLHVVFNHDDAINASPPEKWGEKNTPLDPAIVEELAHRTPSFSAWQESYWEWHCNDAAAFINAVGYRELKKMPREAEAGFRACYPHLSDEQWAKLILVLDRKVWPTGYIFQCLHCQSYVGYIDWGGFTPPICGWRMFERVWRIPWLCRLIFRFRQSLPVWGVDWMYAYPREALEKLEQLQKDENNHSQ